MLVLVSTDLIIKQQLNLDNSGEVSSFFDRVGHDKIIDLGNDLYLTYRQFCENTPPQNLCVPYGPDMFVEASEKVSKYHYAIAKDENGTIKTVIAYQGTTYLHTYTYAGGLDMTFLNSHDCIFLMDCNEFSVEICQIVLKFWTGKRLVLIGQSWNDLVEYLPDLPGIECFYDPQMDKYTIYELTIGMHPLFIKPGLPHQEPLERYLKDSVMYYDEVLALTYMFSDYREPGEKNPGKNFFVLDIGTYGNVGLFSIYNKTNSIIRYIKSKNMIPIVNLTTCNQSMYSDFAGDEIWNKFYNQPEGYTLEDALQSKHVYFSPQFYNGSVLSHIMEKASQDITMSWPNGIYNSKVMALLSEKQKEFLPFPSQTLGVLARGTDYINNKLANHSIHATLEMLFQKIDETLAEKPFLEYIYVATEDAEYCRKFKERYQDKLFCTNQNRFQTQNQEMLAEMHRRNKAHKIDGYTLGTDYILSIWLLSQCRAFIASGGCWGLQQAMENNKGRWDESDIFVFHLGSTPSAGG